MDINLIFEMCFWLGVLFLITSYWIRKKKIELEILKIESAKEKVEIK